MNNTSHDSAHLDDSAVLRVLSHINLHIREKMTNEQQNAVQSLEEASKAVASFLEAKGAALSEDEIQRMAENETVAPRARGMLELMLKDETTRSEAEALVENPPDDSQRSVELAAGGAIILGALIGWLQTKVEIEVSRKGNETQFRFYAKKDSMGEGGLQAIAKSIRALLLV